MFSFEPFAVVMNFTEINSVVAKVTERARRKRNVALVFCGLGVTAFGDDLAAILRRSSSATSLLKDFSSR
jgi:hypothetical protein